MKKNIVNTIALILFAFSLLFSSCVFAPSTARADVFGFAKPDLIVCGAGTPTNPDPNHPNASQPCKFSDLMVLANRIIDFLFYLSIPICVVMFSYAGILYLTAGDDEGKIKKARAIFWNVAKGFAYMCAAWLIVNAILQPFVNTDAGYTIPTSTGATD